MQSLAVVLLATYLLDNVLSEPTANFSSSWGGSNYEDSRSHGDVVGSGLSLEEYYRMQAARGENCWWGTIPCPAGGVVCNNPVEYAGCAFDTISAIMLDNIAGAMGQAVQAFTDDPVGFVIDLGSDMINSAVNDMITCYKGLSGQAPSCTELNTLKACVNTALNAVSVAKAASSGVTAANLKRLDSGLSKMDKVLSLTTDMCKMGCEGGVCGTSDGVSTETLTYSFRFECEVY